MLAWTFARLNVGIPDNHTMRAFAPLIMRLVEGQSGKYQLLHPSADLMRRFFDEQMAATPPVVVDMSKARKGRLR